MNVQYVCLLPDVRACSSVCSVQMCASMTVFVKVCVDIHRLKLCVLIHLHVVYVGVCEGAASLQSSS